MWKFLSDSIDSFYDGLSFENKTSSISSQNLSNNIVLSPAKKNWLRLFIQIIGMLYIFYGILNFVSALLMKGHLPTPIPAIFLNLFWGLMGIALVLAGYKLIKMQEKGRKLAYLLAWANVASLVIANGTLFTIEDSIFSYRFWPFQYEHVSKNLSFDGAMLTLITTGFIGIQIVLILFFLSQAVKELFDYRSNF